MKRWLVGMLLLVPACRERAPYFEMPGTDPERGRAIVRAVGCGACHVIPRVSGADGMVGPPLAGFGGRAYIAGRLANAPDALVRWLLDPPAIDSATAMPRMGLSEVQARDVAAFVYSLGDDATGLTRLLPRKRVRK